MNFDDMVARPNGRDTALFQSACAIGWAFHFNYLSYEFIRDGLMAASRQNGLIAEIGESACEAIIEAGLSYAELDPLPELPPECEIIHLGSKRKRKP